MVVFHQVGILNYLKIGTYSSFSALFITPGLNLKRTRFYLQILYKNKNKNNQNVKKNYLINNSSCQGNVVDLSSDIVWSHHAIVGFFSGGGFIEGDVTGCSVLGSSLTLTTSYLISVLTLVVAGSCLGGFSTTLFSGTREKFLHQYVWSVPNYWLESEYSLSIAGGLTTGAGNRRVDSINNISTLCRWKFELGSSLMSFFTVPWVADGVFTSHEYPLEGWYFVIANKSSKADVKWETVVSYVKNEKFQYTKWRK